MIRLRRILPSALTAMRLLLAGPVGFAVLYARDRLALVLLGLAAATDLLDGPLARRWGTASDRGARFDVRADFAVIVAVFLALGQREVYGYWPVVLAAGLFAQCVLLSRAGTLRSDPLGRAYGAFMFGIAAGTLVLPDSAVHAVMLATLLIVSAIVLAGRFRLLPGP